MSTRTAPPAVRRRHAVLLELARLLESAEEPAAFFASLHERLRPALPGRAFLAALRDDDAGLHILFTAGETEGCEAHARVAIEAAKAEASNGEGKNAANIPAWPADADGPVFLSAPLRRDGRLLGCLVVEREPGADFDEDERGLLEAIAAIAAAAVDAAGLRTLAASRADEIERLDAVARDLAGTLEMDQVAERVAEHAHALVDKPVVVWVVEGERARAVARAGGALIEIGQEREAPPAEVERILRDAAALRGGLEASDDGDRIAAITSAVEPTTSAPAPLEDGRISVALSLGQRLVGLLAVGPWTDEPIDREKLRLLLRMAPYGASAIENARLHEELRQLSLTDPLVDLPNRRRFDIILEQEFAAAERGRPLTLVLFDLDHFKEYNDTYGHHEGDEALISFARVLRTETRSMNLAARFGGEEFAVVLSPTGTAGGRAYADRVRRRIADETEGRLTVSAGVASYHPSMQEPMDLVVAADRALYQAKADGRDRVRVADD